MHGTNLPLCCKEEADSGPEISAGDVVVEKTAWSREKIPV